MLYSFSSYGHIEHFRNRTIFLQIQSVLEDDEPNEENKPKNNDELSATLKNAKSEFRPIKKNWNCSAPG